jgi:hypothetical protein
MDTVLRGLGWKYCLVYIGDVIVFSKDFPTHLARLEQVFETFRQANLKLKLSKCAFVMEKVEYLGFRVTNDGLQPNLDKVRAIVEMETPTEKIPRHN